MNSPDGKARIEQPKEHGDLKNHYVADEPVITITDYETLKYATTDLVETLKKKSQNAIQKQESEL